MDSDPQRLEDIGRIRDALRQISQEAQVAVDLLDAKIEDERLDGRTEAEDVRAILELIQNLYANAGSNDVIVSPSGFKRFLSSLSQPEAVESSTAQRQTQTTSLQKVTSPTIQTASSPGSCTKGDTV